MISDAKRWGINALCNFFETNTRSIEMVRGEKSFCGNHDDINRESRRSSRLVDTHLHGHVEPAAGRCVPINSLVTLPRKTHEVHRSSGRMYVRTYVTSICSAFARIRTRSPTVYPVRSALRYWTRFSTAVRFVAPHDHTPLAGIPSLAHTRRRTLSFHRHGWHRIVPANCPELCLDWTPRSSRSGYHEFPRDGSTLRCFDMK